MKAIQVLLLNVVTVVVGLLVYDQLRGNDSRSSSERATSTRSEPGESIKLERRLQQIEAKLAALPQAKDWDRAAMDELAKARDAAEKEEPPAPIRESTDARAVASDEPTEAEVARYRKLREAVRREEIIEKNWDRIERRLKKANVNLTKRQRRQVHEAYADFQPRIDGIWGEIKTEAAATTEAGGEVDGKTLWQQGNQRIQSEFAASLTGIVNHQADAEAVAAALTGRVSK